MNKGEIYAAVKQETASGKKGFLQKLFALWFDALVYNQIWEDPVVDVKALSPLENSGVLTISSGGGNALNYLLSNPQHITATDLNRYHIYLLNLKIVAINHLPDYEDFFSFFGRGKHKDAQKLYAEFLAPNLDTETRGFWESGTYLQKLHNGNRIDFFTKRGLYDYSRNGYFLRAFHGYAHLIGCHPEAVLTARNEAEQRTLAEEHIARFFDSRLIRTICKLPLTVFGLGVPPQQYNELKEEIGANGSLNELYRARAVKLATAFPIEDNYFAWQAFGRKFDYENRRAIPDYLRKENFEYLRENLHKLKTNIGSVTSVIRDSPKNTFDRFVFLDAQDWMNAKDLNILWQLIADRAKPNSRIIFRSAIANSPIQKLLAPKLLSRFEYLENLSNNLYKQDRASIYGGFHVYRKLN
ncbi:MAG: DUF3419 family protein [Pyrinomonadaceae bacterium]